MPKKKTKSKAKPKSKLPDFDFGENTHSEPSEPDFVEIGGSPVPGLTLRHVLRGHTGAINRIAWSPDGKYLATPSSDGTIRVWDANKNHCIYTLKVGTYQVWCVAWSIDGTKLASGDHENTIKIWNTKEWSVIKELHGHTGPIASLAWSPNSKLLASRAGDHDANTYIWDVDTGKPIDKFYEGAGLGNVVLWEAKGQYLISAAEDSSINVWDFHIMPTIKQTLNNSGTSIRSVTIIPDTSLLIAGDERGKIHIWDINSGQHLSSVEGHTNYINSLSISNDKKILASKGADGVRLWKTNSWKSLVYLKETKSGDAFSGNLAFHPNEPYLITLGENDTIIRIWELDEVVLSGQEKENVNYTTAKLVLVGDSGVGKTGLGWRLAHGEFKEHASTQGKA